MNKALIVFELVQQIPRGKVSTYKILAQASGIKNPRQVGAILHTNTDSASIPCHRVVKSDGVLASGYAFGGRDKQKEILVSEKIVFKGFKIDLTKYIYRF